GSRSMSHRVVAPVHERVAPARARHVVRGTALFEVAASVSDHLPHVAVVVLGQLRFRFLQDRDDRPAGPVPDALALAPPPPTARPPAAASAARISAAVMFTPAWKPSQTRARSTPWTVRVAIVGPPILPGSKPRMSTHWGGCSFGWVFALADKAPPHRL